MDTQPRPAGHADHGTSAADYPTAEECMPSDTLHEGTTRGLRPDHWQSFRRYCTSTWVKIWPWSQTDWWRSSEMVKEYESSSNVRGTTRDTPIGATPTEIDAAYKDQHRGDEGKHAKGNIREKKKGKGKRRGKQQSSTKFQGYCGHRGKW